MPGRTSAWPPPLPPAAANPPSLVCCCTFQVVREHYLRDDIYSGSPLDPACPPEACKLSGEAPHYLLVDTNVALHQAGGSCACVCCACLGKRVPPPGRCGASMGAVQPTACSRDEPEAPPGGFATLQMDLLEHAAVTDVIVPSVVLEEVKARNASAYQRLRQLAAADAKRFFVFANEHHRQAAWRRLLLCRCRLGASAARAPHPTPPPGHRSSGQQGQVQATRVRLVRPLMLMLPDNGRPLPPAGRRM